MANNERTSAELQAAIARRKVWFFECQLRRLSAEQFRDIEPSATNEALLTLLSEADPNGPPPGSSEITPPLIYLDSRQPVWTQAERDQRSAFKDITSGTYGSWFNYNDNPRLAKKLADLQTAYESSKYGANWEVPEALKPFARENPVVPFNGKTIDHELIAHAIARAALGERRPWLIPELFNFCDPNADIFSWIDNAGNFLRYFENELSDSTGIYPPTDDENNSIEAYRNWASEAFQASVTPFLRDGKKKTPLIQTYFINQTGDDWKIECRLSTPAYRIFTLIYFYKDHSAAAPYWFDASLSKLRETYINKSESDMGLCQTIRMLYLFGALESPLFDDKEITWRKRTILLEDNLDNFRSFFRDRLATLETFEKDDRTPAYQLRLSTIHQKMEALLFEQAAQPRSASWCFSPVCQEFHKQATLKYKFWLDEAYSNYDYHGEKQDEGDPKGLNKAKLANGIKADELFAEKEYWSENHYIMFASSEFLAGQFWWHESFQPAADFLEEKDRESFGRLSGAQRMERGKARVLKWLNNKMMFGWTEFNSSGYYREHLWSLLNLVDFSVDEEVKRKATLVTDLLLFDITRFLHKGSMGAAGGRSQFPSKNSGWDNSLADAIEILFGERGVFKDKDSEIGCSIATSSYTVPNVFLQMVNNPPAAFHVDRSRVSIGFDDAPKFGIDYSKKTDQFRSLFDGFESKRRRYYDFMMAANAAITASHNDYGAWQDDTVFWWSQSAYYNKEVVRNSFKCVKKYKLYETEVFAKLRTILDVLSHLKRIADIGGIVIGTAGTLAGWAVKTVSGGALGLPGFLGFDDVTENHLESLSDDFSAFLDGSTRSRINIYTSGNRDIKLSSVQNFRTGQLNIQSNISQATISTGLNVFTTAGFAGMSMSDIPFAALGSVPFYAVGLGPLAAPVLGSVAGIAANRLLIEDTNPFGKQGDGPGWWTGYWALPMVVQHDSAAIMIYDFNWLQRRMTDVGSHAWFPKQGFDQTQKMRSSAYEDTNFPGTDFTLDLKEFPTFGFDKRGYWLFGKKVHFTDPLDPTNDEEAYIGVFSNRSPDFLDKHDDFYAEQIKKQREAIEKAIADADEAGAAALHRNWDRPIFDRIFDEKDFYAQGKNIWIVQIGNKQEYGSFDNFKQIASSAKVAIDDTGDMECAYTIPKPGGASQELSVKYKDEITLNGSDFQADFYPRFESMFIRGRRVEWQQREYVIEYRGESLLHDFSNWASAESKEGYQSSDKDVFLVKGLVIYLRTLSKEMEVFTTASATVMINCETLAEDETVAAGQVGENNYHDAEWIYFDRSAISDPFMTIDISHHKQGGRGADDSKWKMSFTMSALMGDRTLRPCTIGPTAFGTFYFEEGQHNTGRIPFSIQLFQWRTWKVIENIYWLSSWWMARQMNTDHFYHSSVDEFAINKKNVLLHRRRGPCAALGEWIPITNPEYDEVLQVNSRVLTYAPLPGYVFVLVLTNGQLYARWLEPGKDWTAQYWRKLTLSYLPYTSWLPGFIQPEPNSFALGAASQLQSCFFAVSPPQSALFVSGPDGEIYASSEWWLDGPGRWRKIITASIFTLSATVPFQVIKLSIYALDTQGRMWAYSFLPGAELFLGSWHLLPAPPAGIDHFIATSVNDTNHVILSCNNGTVWTLTDTDGHQRWQRIGDNSPFLAEPKVKLACTVTSPDRLDVIAAGRDGKIYSTSLNKENTWKINHFWTVVDVDGHTFNATPGSQLEAVSRVRGQLEVYVTDKEQNLRHNWWS